MTVKIVKPGILPDTIERDGKCNYCKCEFTFTPNDAILQTDQREGDYYKLPCPTCAREVFVSTRSRQ
jgi:hypothetical protein